ncbi:hypothetical protein FDP41_000997 [Naegleria fowleri]|uniref:Molybdate-anion transporter n=1 Tax=Naegleria fowleri TaxID=5763 RepID=A0A6A5BZT6_NAEFO|nr:uncharacterized protein FDP41_000997 [Naegleria fowleri]KAF0979844.1 hypothetical protein FDP41_000997 [Naegleria fowleri]
MFSVLAALMLICAGLIYFNQTRTDNREKVDSQAFTRFQYIYLGVYLCMTFSDWLQGAYVYVLYESYGYHIDMISKLFIVGFLSSMLFGTIIGALSDKLGRKNVCLAFVVLYIISCITKHSSNLTVLLIGRLTGGIATSILYSSFESWMVYEHFNRYNFSSSWIGDTFYKQTFSNGIIAIVAGFVSNLLYNLFNKSAVAPFDAAILCLVIGGGLILYYWEENYGDRTGDYAKNFSEGFKVIRSDLRVLCVAISQSFFEAAMYIFVLMWTPTLNNSVKGQELEIGYIFAAFMLAVMIGSLVFRALLVNSDEVEKKDDSNFVFGAWRSPEYILLFVFGLALVSLIVPIVSSSFYLILFGFLMFEFCVGIFWPAISTVKSVYIPEDVRSTVMNYIRIPTNFLVVLSLYFVDNIPQFPVCCLLLTVALVSQYWLLQHQVKSQNTSTSLAL